MINCKYCLVDFEKKWKGNKFCSRSCSQAFNNSVWKKRGLKPIYCNFCGDKIERTGWKDRPTIHPECIEKKRKQKREIFKKKYGGKIKVIKKKQGGRNRNNCVDWSKVTLKEMNEIRMYQKNSRIRNLARKIYFSSDKPKQCVHCGYNLHFDVCHVKPIADFPDTATVAAINNLANLIALCKNHHWEFDHGFLVLNYLT